ncbi:MAG: hypothetical protein ACTHU0_39065, partial [Kofleriaceae bacterium]
MARRPRARVAGRTVAREVAPNVARAIERHRVAQPLAGRGLREHAQATRRDHRGSLAGGHRPLDRHDVDVAPRLVCPERDQQLKQ